MKLLHTIGYDGQPFTVPVDRIIAVKPYTCVRCVPFEEDEKTPGAQVFVQDLCEGGSAYVVREKYESVIAKLEAL